MSGLSPTFSERKLLSKLVLELTKEHHDAAEFDGPSGSDYLVKFCNARISTSILKSVHGEYVCFRPGTDVIVASEPYVASSDADEHRLSITYHSEHQPGTFRYATSRGGKHVDAWNGYAVSQGSCVFLFGLCERGEDASFMIFTPHPSDGLDRKILIGIQSLLLPHPKTHAKSAVCRHIVAVSHNAASNRQTLAAALNWIDESRKSSNGLLVSLEQLTQKT